MSSYILVSDISTSGCKAFLFDERYKTIASSTVAYPRKTFGACYEEQDPDELISIFQESLKRCIAQSQIPQNQIIGMGFCTSPYSFIGVDRDGNPIIPVSWWGDRKFLSKSDLKSLIPKMKDMYFRTGCPLNSTFPISRILHLKKKQPKAFSEVYKFLSIKGYIISLLTKEFVEDISCASGMGALDLRERRWDARLLADMDIEEEKLPNVVSTYQIVGEFPDDIGRACGIKTRIPIIMGASDIASASLGTISTNIDNLCINLGYSGSIMKTSRALPLFDQDYRLWYHCIDNDSFVWGGSTNNGASIVKWFVQKFFPQGLAPQILEKEMSKRFTQPSKITSYPFFWGERTPFWNPQLNGIFFGLDFTHSPFDILYALMEGISFSLCHIYEMIRDLSGLDDKIRLTGGGFHWNFVAQHLCDLLQKPLEVPEFLDATALGAAAIVRRARKLPINEEALISASMYKTIFPRLDIGKQIRNKYLKWKNNLEYTIDFLCHDLQKDADYIDLFRKHSFTPPGVMSDPLIKSTGKNPVFVSKSVKQEETYFFEEEPVKEIIKPEPEKKKLGKLEVLHLPNLKPEKIEYVERKVLEEKQYAQYEIRQDELKAAAEKQILSEPAATAPQALPPITEHHADVPAAQTTEQPASDPQSVPAIRKPPPVPGRAPARTLTPPPSRTIPGRPPQPGAAPPQPPAAPMPQASEQSASEPLPSSEAGQPADFTDATAPEQQPVPARPLPKPPAVPGTRPQARTAPPPTAQRTSAIPGMAPRKPPSPQEENIPSSEVAEQSVASDQASSLPRRKPPAIPVQKPAYSPPPMIAQNVPQQQSSQTDTSMEQTETEQKPPQPPPATGIPRRPGPAFRKPQ